MINQDNSPNQSQGASMVNRSIKHDEVIGQSNIFSREIMDQIQQENQNIQICNTYFRGYWKLNLGYKFHQIKSYQKVNLRDDSPEKADY